MKFFDPRLRCAERPPTAVADGKSRDHFGFWQGLLRVVGSFGDCPRCLAVCPVGNDYHAHLAEVAEGDLGKELSRKSRWAKSRQEARRLCGDAIAGLNPWNVRWVGPEGYKGIVARQMQEFKKVQKASARPWPRQTRTAGARHDLTFRQPLTAADIKDKAHELGADLIGIADGANLNAIRPIPDSAPADRHDELDDSRVIVLAKRVNSGVARITGWNDRHKYYNDELALSPARRDIARAGLLAGRQRLSGNHHPADPRRSLDIQRQSEAASDDNALAAARRGRSGTRDARP